MGFVKAVFRILVGLIFGLLAALALSPAIAAFNASPDSKSPILIPVVVVLMAIITFLAPSIRRAFGRGFLVTGLCFLLLPISAMLLSGRAAHDVVNAADKANQAATALGAGIGGVLVTGLATFVGLIVGAVFIILGLVLALGGRREVVIVNQPAMDRGRIEPR